MKRIASLNTFMLSLLLVAGCAMPAAADDAVYRDFGEKAGLTHVMDDFMNNLLADNRINHYFPKTDQTRLKSQLVDQFCALLEGPCQYKGRDMDEAHSGLNIDTADFNALVEDLQAAMSKNNVPFSSQNKLLAKLAPMHRVVITK
jgi:hemoglobin